jgi:AcrR family transcriptional regulator
MDRKKRQHILGVALRHFADRGYAGTSVQDIADKARVAKPMLYYYFQNKAGLYQASMDRVHEERFQVLSEAARGAETLDEKLTAILMALFKFIKNHREAVRLSFASAFAAPGEMPPELCYKEKCRQSFEFFHELMIAGQERGELSTEFDSREVAMAWYGLMNIYVMGQILQPEICYDERTARSMVDLFFRGAGAKGKKKGPVRSS